MLKNLISDFVELLMTLLSLVAVSAQSDECHLVSDTFCRCGPTFHSVVALTDTAFKRTFCGGSLINDKQVLTLAQCVGRRNPQDLKVVVKLYNGEPESIYDVESIDFHTESHHAGRDIAIVNIVQTLNERDANGTVCLPFCYSDLSFVGIGFRIMGWFRHADEKREIISSERVALNVVDGCVYDDEYLRNNTLCIDKRDIDKYDGGEPVFWKMTDQVQLQIGIVLPRISRDGDKLTVVLRLGRFAEWIESRAPKGYSYCKYM